MPFSRGMDTICTLDGWTRRSFTFNPMGIYFVVE